METRKLQQVGGGTYTVSVPKEWAREQSLEVGARIHLYTHTDGSLVVRTEEKGGGNRTVRVGLDDADPAAIRRAVAAAHAAGVDTMTLVGSGAFTEAERAAADAATRNLVGMEMIDVGNGEITVGTLLDASELSVRQSVLQLQFTVVSMLRRAGEAVRAGDDTVEAFRERGGETDRLFDLIARQFTRSLCSFETLDRLGLPRPELFEYYQIARHLDAIGGEVAGIVRVLGRRDDALPEAPADAIADAIGAAGRVVDDATSAVLDGEGSAGAHDALDRCEALERELAAIERAVSETGSGDASAVRVLDHVVRVVDCATGIAEVALRRATRTGNA
mgnify:CR=1 FL=1